MALIANIERILLSFTLMLSLKTAGPFFAGGRTWVQVFEHFFDYIRKFLTPGLLDVMEKTTKEKIAALKPMDDVLFRRLMLTDQGQMQKFLRDITCNPDLELEFMETQRDLPSIGGYRGVIADAYAESMRRKIVFIMESQNNATADIEDRGIYELESMGYRTLYPGDPYNKIPEQYVIFLVNNDVYGDKKLLHHKKITTKTGKGVHLLVLWCHDINFSSLPAAENDIDDVSWLEICKWSNDFVQLDYKKIKNEVFSDLVKSTKAIRKGRKVNRLSEEMYKDFERFYENHTVAKISEARKQERYEMAKGLLEDDVAVDIVSKRSKIPVEELLSMKADMEKEDAG